MTRQLSFFESSNVIRLLVGRRPNQRKFSRPAVVLVFPPAARRSVVVAAATRLLALPTDDAKAKYWVPIIQSARAKMIATGISFDRAEAALQDFRDAVQREMDDRGGHKAEGR